MKTSRKIARNQDGNDETRLREKIRKLMENVNNVVMEQLYSFYFWHSNIIKLHSHKTKLYPEGHSNQKSGAFQYTGL